MSANLKVFVVGRASGANNVDIELPRSEDTVGRRHAEITLGTCGSCHVVDLDSKNGTFVRDKNGAKWRRVGQASLKLGDSIRLGDYVTTVSDLFQFRRADRRIARQPAPDKPVKPPATAQKSQSRPRRNPLTGEIE
jgi:pSer/pThr/pTyr-binding forkhead associated (FHA) protein